MSFHPSTAITALPSKLLPFVGQLIIQLPIIVKSQFELTVIKLFTVELIVFPFKSNVIILSTSS
nr:hypothetical protein [bacterium]